MLHPPYVELYCSRLRLTLTRSASEVAKSLPRLRFGLVWIGTISTADSIVLVALWKAFACALDLKIDPWEFSLQLSHLVDMGSDKSNLRWLVLHRYVTLAICDENLKTRPKFSNPHAVCRSSDVIGLSAPLFSRVPAERTRVGHATAVVCGNQARPICPATVAPSTASRNQHQKSALRWVCG